MSKVFFLLILSFTLFSASHAQQSKPDKNKTNDKNTQDDIVRVDTTLVTIPVSVMDRSGKFVPDLQKDVFRIYEDGNEQTIAYFDTTSSPFTVALLLDTSDSTVFKLGDIQKAAISFVNQLREDDKVIVYAFDANVVKVCDATNDRQKIFNAIKRTQTGGGTSLYTAVDTAINETLRKIRGRKAVVIFTDGIDTTSRRSTFDSTLDLVQELDAIIYTIQYATNGYSPDPNENSTYRKLGGSTMTTRGESVRTAYERGTRYLRFVSDYTGGRFYFASSLSSLEKTFAQIAAELSRQYSLSYYPNNQDAAHTNRKLKVKVDLPKVAVRARRSYVFK